VIVIGHEGSARIADFNKIVAESIDEAVANLLGQSVVSALHLHLLTHYDVSQDELPHRLDTLSTVLEENFGPVFKTIEKSVARTLFHMLGLTFHDVPNRSLSQYIDEAKRRLSK